MRIKKLIAGLMTSAMVLGMSLTTFAADAPLSVAGQIAKDAKSATVNVSAAAGTNLGSFRFYVDFDKDVFDYASTADELQNQLKAFGVGQVIVNDTKAASDGRITVVGADMNVVSKDVLTKALAVKLTVKEGVTEDAAKAALAKVQVSSDKLTDKDGNVLASKDVTLAPAVIGESGVTVEPDDTTTPPADTTTTAPANPENPGTTTAPGTGTTTAPAKTTTAPAPGTTNTAPPTGDMTNVVVPMVALCAAAAAIVVVSKKRVNE